MTPMIDVVFQLLIYFLVTFETPDVFANLDVFRPSAEAQRERTETPPKMIRILVTSGERYSINERPVTKNKLNSILSKLASYDTDQTIMIQCTSDSQHHKLVDVLDMCAKNRLTNLSVISMN